MANKKGAKKRTAPRTRNTSASNKDKTHNVQKHKDYLTLLSKTKKKKDRTLLVDAGNKHQIRAVKECIHNVIEGNVPITERQINVLRQYQRVLEALARKCVSVKKSKHLLKQKGGFLGTLLPIGLQVLGSLFSGE